MAGVAKAQVVIILDWREKYFLLYIFSTIIFANLDPQLLYFSLHQLLILC